MNRRYYRLMGHNSGIDMKEDTCGECNEPAKPSTFVEQGKEELVASDPLDNRNALTYAKRQKKIENS